jgi:hydrogenase nickel incorporation protein HypA/HybF
MHEASLMTNLMHRIDKIAQAERARRIVRVSIWLGALCHLSAEHFAEHFQTAAAGTIAEAAQLNVTVSDDTCHEHAQDLLLESIKIEI